MSGIRTSDQLVTRLAPQHTEQDPLGNSTPNFENFGFKWRFYKYLNASIHYKHLFWAIMHEKSKNPTHFAEIAVFSPNTLKNQRKGQKKRSIFTIIFQNIFQKIQNRLIEAIQMNSLVLKHFRMRSNLRQKQRNNLFSFLKSCTLSHFGARDRPSPV